MLYKIGYFFRTHWVKHLVALFIGVANMCIYCANDGWTHLSSYYNGTAVAGLSLVFIGLLSLVNGFGAFDMASFYMMRRRVDATRQENYYEYATRKAEQRSKDRAAFVPYLIVAALFLIASGILSLVAMSGA